MSRLNDAPSCSGFSSCLHPKVELFGKEWEAGRRPDIAAHLPDGPARTAVLIELVHIDLERRLNAGEPVRVELYLYRYPELAAAPTVLLSLLAAEYSIRRRSEIGLTVAEYLERFPALAAGITRRLRADVPEPPPVPETRIEAPGVPTTDYEGAGLPPVPPVAERTDHRPPEGPGAMRYRLMQFHAQGGLGEVHVAEDRELGRKVALKRIRRECAGDAENRARFLREAEITARLEHPGVVPVHGLMRDANGEPCYAMRFVQGRTLAEAVRDFHEADKGKRRPGERRLALRQLLGSFVAVCQTIAYAHSRGVLHRDLKPANVMLGPFGETLVVDWGLAKSFDRSEEDRDKGEDTVRPRADPDVQETRLGQAAGTPAYMAPEQAAGQWHVVGPATDVYGLGATLYHLLTGQAPFGGPARDILGRVQRGNFLPPRQINRRVPRALEAACLKAMALRPEDRYPAPLELAKDIENWLADEPVTAYREPLLARVGRWGRRHRAWAQAGAASLVLITAVSLTAVVIVLRAWKHEEAEAQRADENATAVVAQTERTLLAAERKLDEVKRLAGKHAADVAAQQEIVTALGPRRELIRVRWKDEFERAQAGFKMSFDRFVAPIYENQQRELMELDKRARLETLLMDDPTPDIALAEATVRATRSRLAWARNASSPLSTLELAHRQATLRIEQSRADLEVAKSQLQQAIKVRMRHELEAVQLQNRIQVLEECGSGWKDLYQRAHEAVKLGSRGVTKSDADLVNTRRLETEELLLVARKSWANLPDPRIIQSDVDLALARVAEAETRLDEALTLAGEPRLNRVAGNSAPPSELPVQMAPAPDAPEIWGPPIVPPVPAPNIPPPEKIRPMPNPRGKPMTAAPPEVIKKRPWVDPADSPRPSQEPALFFAISWLHDLVQIGKSLLAEPKPPPSRKSFPARTT
jgi:serine/threonine protein kinase